MLKKVFILMISIVTILSIHNLVNAEDTIGNEFIEVEQETKPSEEFKIETPNTTRRMAPRAANSGIYTSGNYQYKIEENYRIIATDVNNKIISDKTEDIAVIINYTGTENTVTIPTTLGGKRVYKIETGAFYQNTSIKKLIIPDNTVGYIGDGAFADCTNLAEVSLGNSVNNISYYAFQRTAITSIKLPASLEAIRNTTFFNCAKLTNITIDSKNVHFKVIDNVIYKLINSGANMSLILYPYAKTDKVYTIPNNVTSIEYEAVLNQYVETINIPASVINISTQYTFLAQNLKNINVNTSNKNYASINGVVFSKDKTTLILYPAGRTETSYTIPTGTKKIGQDAFFKIQKLKNINIPNTVTEIDVEAFGYAESLETINIPSSVTTLNAQLFRECTNLKKVIVSANSEVLPYLMFRECANLEEVQINGNIKKIIKGAFYYCPKLTKVTLPDSLEQIQFGAFWCCRGLKNITIPKNVTLLEECAFYEYLNNNKGYWADTVFDISKTELEKQSTGDYIAVYNGTVKGTRHYQKAYEVLRIVNEQRRNVGLKELTMDKDLLENAMLRAAETVVYFEHERPSGLDCFSAITKLSYGSAGENIAAYQTTANQVMNSWMNSLGHRANILKSNYTSIGIGCYQADNGRYYWTQIFTDGTPTTTTQPKNKDTVETIKILYNRIPFEDVPNGSWYYNAVKYTYKNGIIAGYNSKTFAPLDNVSRGQLVTMLWRKENKPDTSKLKNNFTDVPEKGDYTEGIKWANAQGIVKGYGGTTEFGPGDPITRQDLAIVLNKYAKYKGKNATGTASLTRFKDYKTVSDYAENAVKWTVQNGIISGNSLPDGSKTIAPHDNATRAEIAVMLQKFFEKF